MTMNVSTRSTLGSCLPPAVYVALISAEERERCNAELRCADSAKFDILVQ